MTIWHEIYPYTIQELEKKIQAIKYTMSGSQSLGWLITLNTGKQHIVPEGTEYNVAVKLAKRLAG